MGSKKVNQYSNKPWSAPTQHSNWSENIRSRNIVNLPSCYVLVIYWVPFDTMTGVIPRHHILCDDVRSASKRSVLFLSGITWVRVIWYSPKCRHRRWGPHSFLFSGYWGYFPGVKRPEHEADNLPQSSAEVKNKRNCTSTPTGTTFLALNFTVSNTDYRVEWRNDRG
jgi:hypothetical protein